MDDRPSPEGDDLEERRERLSEKPAPQDPEQAPNLAGEPAPAVTPEEFARLQDAGQVHIDARGRVRTARRSDAEAGVSLRKRRAWYGR
ncbi:MAG: hypothetical protein J4G17_01850 [Anaerolineae bacterium]|nr:hypothetical protein [Anaerolineae bacterium]